MKYSIDSLVRLISVIFLSSALTLGALLALFPDASFYLFFLVLSVFAVTCIVSASIYARSYGPFPCMTGMMIGMTLGMLAGFFPGFILGATNGMFWGSMVGMFVGILVGVWNGKCCGIMGIMEGLMAGMMGGLMGAMTSLMTIADHLYAMSFVVFGIGGIITLTFHLLVQREAHLLEKEQERRHKLVLTLLSSSLITLALCLMILFGPRGGLHV